MRKWLLSAALLSIATPASADWAPTRWGMTPAQVVSAVPNAELVVRHPGLDFDGLHWLADALVSDAGTDLHVKFYFEPVTQRLALIGLSVIEKDNCNDYRRVLFARWGEGRVSQKVDGMDERTTKWTDPASQDHLIFTELLAFEHPLLCNLIIRKP